MHRTIGGMIELIGYDADGVVQIEIRIPPERMSDRWEGWLLRWLRHQKRPNLTLVD